MTKSNTKQTFATYMKFEQIIQEIKAEKYYPVYFLMGEEPYFIDEIEKLLESKILTPDEKEFNQSILYGKDVLVEHIIAEVRSYPMMSQYRVVIVREAQNIKDWELMESYFAHPMESTILIICHKYKSLDKRKTISKVLEKSKDCVLFTSEKIQSYKINEWISSYCRQNKIKIQDRAVDFLAEYIGAEPSKLSNEIEKLTLALGPEVEITHEHIMENVGIHKDFNIFELIKALSLKNMSRAVKITDYFVQNQKSHNFHALNPQLYTFFGRLMEYKYHHLTGKNEGEILSIMKLRFPASTDVTAGARNYTLPSLRRIMIEISDADLRSKGIGAGQMESGEVLRDLVYKILSY